MHKILVFSLSLSCLNLTKLLAFEDLLFFFLNGKFQKTSTGHAAAYTIYVKDITLRN